MRNVKSQCFTNERLQSNLVNSMYSGLGVLFSSIISSDYREVYIKKKYPPKNEFSPTYILGA